MARRARRAAGTFPAAPRLVLRPAGPALGRGGPAAPRTAGKERLAMRWVLLGTIVVLSLLASVVLGPAAVPFSELSRSDIVWNLRAPRAVLAFLVGGSLGFADAGLQALVRNPLAD